MSDGDKMLVSIKKYFKDVSPEIIKKDFEETDRLYNVGVTFEEYIEALTKLNTK